MPSSPSVGARADGVTRPRQGRSARPASARADTPVVEAASADLGDDAPDPGRNEVALRGRLAAVATSRALPSGDELVTFRLVVPRPSGRRPPTAARQVTVDTIDCVAWSSRVRRAALAWPSGATLDVEGALRRRFWRGPAGGPASRCEVEVTSAKVVRR